MSGASISRWSASSSSPCPGPAIRRGRSTTPAWAGIASRYRTQRPARCCIRAATTPCLANGNGAPAPASMTAASRNRCASRCPTPRWCLRVSARGSNNTFVPVWSLTVDPASPDITRQVPPLGVAPIAIRQSGPPATKVDLLILGDGYTAAELPKFEADARRLAAHLFTVSPFRERAGDFNVWALAKPTHVSGVPRPSGGKHGASVTGLRYDTFGGERFLFSLDNRALRELAQYAPYDVIEVAGQQRHLWRRRNLRPVQHGRGRQHLVGVPVRARVRASLRRAWPTSTTPRTH